MVTNREKLECAERELKFRFRVYDRLVARGKMTKTEQAREIELMSAIVEDYRALAAADEPEFAICVETRRSVEPLTEGMVRKGRRNQGPSQIKERPDPPGPIYRR